MPQTQTLRNLSNLHSDTPPPSKIPTIRLIHATPSTAAPNPNETLLTPTSPERPMMGSRRRSVRSKKSKLGLLSGSRRNDDFSDITRRLGISPTAPGSDIYVDPSHDPDIGEIVVVKKEKARGKLESIRWALGDKANANSQSSDEKEKAKKEKKEKAKGISSKPKGEEKDRWWTIGRGRKDLKESKGKDRPKSPGPGAIMSAFPMSNGGLPTPPPSARPSPPPRHNSFDSNALLSENWRAGSPSPSPSPAQIPLPGSRAATPALIIPMPDESKDTRNGGSLAIRAMRSMASLAKLGTWGQQSNPAPTRRAKDSNETTSSWEVGEPSVVRSLLRTGGLDGSLRRSRGSKQSSSSYGTTQKRFSAETNQLGMGRPSAVNRLSTLSTASSVAPVSTYSGDTRSYKTSTDSDPSSHRLSSHSDESEAVGMKRASKTSSIRWDDNIETLKAKRKGAKERRGGNTVATRRKDGSQRSSQRSAEARQRGSLAALFPQILDAPAPPTKDPKDVRLVETTDLAVVEVVLPTISPSSPATTPPRKVRPRPQSEQLLGRTDRPQGVVASEDGDAVISILNAATSDLASLINRLDLQATPDASGFTPGSQFGSRDPTNKYGTPAKRDDVQKTPSKKSPRESPSITSLRPYNRMRDSTATTESKGSTGPVFTLPNLSRVNLISATRAVPSPVVEEDMEPVFTRAPLVSSSTTADQSILKPSARSRTNLRLKESKSKVNLHKSKSSITALAAALQSEAPIPPVSNTSGAKSEEEGSAQGHSECSSKISYPNSLPPKIKTRDELRREFGFNGTFGDFGEDIGLAEDPDSDIPEELHYILKKGSKLEVDDTISYNGESPLGRAIGSPSDLAHSSENVCSTKKAPSVSPCPGLPPAMPLPALSKDLGPVFRATLTDDQDREAALNEPDSPCSPLENETKKSFDFTGELNKLNASGEGNRLSFLEQLEMAFPDPAKLQSFDFDRSMLMPSISFKLTAPGNMSANLSYSREQESKTHSDSVAQIQHVEPTPFEDVALPSVVSPPTVLDSTRGSSISPLVIQNASTMGLHPRSSIISRSSDSELSWTFHKDGVKSLAGPMQFSASNGELPLLRKSRSTSSLIEEDSSVLKSIYGHAIPATEEAPPVPVLPRQRLESDTSSKRVARQATITSHTRTGSEVSFSGFESFSQIRAKFEFMNEQSNYFPEIDLSKKSHSKHESVFSIASVSSYGQVLSGGARDPFNYGYHSRPGSEDLTGSVNDTFSFLKQDPHNKRLSTDSDISGFYFRPGVGQRRGHNRANESVASIYSISGPPVSIYNRSHGQSFGHSRTDSWASGSSLAHAYGSGGANGGRAAWARHVRDQSVQSIEFSAQRLGRPGIGDKMFSSHDPGVPLTAISASPPDSAARERYPNGPVRDSVSDGNRISADSIFDEHNKPSADSIFDEHRTSSKDSIFDGSNNRSSASSDSIFGHDQHRLRAQHHRAQFRPISMLSSESSESRKEDDTMLTMFNGDHVRRQSIGSSFEASPCIRMEKHLRDTKSVPSPVVKRTLETIPSIQFGEGRMDMARRGLLERQSLEASCLVGDGEEMDRSFGPPTITLRQSPEALSRPDSLLSESSGGATPPLCASESGGSQSSIDTQHLDALLTNATRPSPSQGRLRPRGQGHRRGHSQISSTSAFSSIITIEEETQGSLQNQNMLSPVMNSYGAGFSTLSPDGTFTRTEQSSVYIVQEEDEETGEVLRKYWALMTEADATLAESQVVWPDTPFSMYALQTFIPPHDPDIMKSMLEHSKMVFGPLPLELRVRKTRSRTSSRASPYPQPLSSNRSHNRSRSRSASPHHYESHSPILQVLQSIPTNTPGARTRRISVQKVDKAALAAAASVDKPTPVKSIPRQRIPSNARRAALGWSKRNDQADGNANRSFANKENVLSASTTSVFSPTESLRINRPRPRGRVR